MGAPGHSPGTSHVPLSQKDLPGVVRSQVKLFTDECLLYRQIKSNKDHVLLQKDLTELEIWAS